MFLWHDNVTSTLGEREPNCFNANKTWNKRLQLSNVLMTQYDIWYNIWYSLHVFKISEDISEQKSTEINNLSNLVINKWITL